jgi:hypothetical protein
MARKKMPLDADRIVALMSVGRTAEEITAALVAEGAQVSRATITRRMRELKGKAKAAKADRAKARRAAAPAPVEMPPLPKSADDVPDDADPTTLDWWLAKAEELARQAETVEDFDTFGKMGRLAATLLEHRRKAQPPPEVDPNDTPDMVALGAQVAERLHRMIDQVEGS